MIAAHLVVASLKGKREIGAIEFLVTVPISSGPSRIQVGTVLIFTSLKDLNQVGRFKKTIQTRIADCCLLNNPRVVNAIDLALGSVVVE